MTTQPESDLGSRLYGMMQYLLTAHVQGVEPEPVDPREVVTKQDALDAVILLAAAVDEQVQNQGLDAERGVWIVSLLMVIRDYIEPLPLGLNEDGGTDLVVPDLQEMVSALRAARNGMSA